MKLVPTLFVALFLVALAGCASSQQADSAFDQGGADEIEIEVQNLNFADATVWAIVENSRRTRLGTVTGKSDQTFTMPWDFSLRLGLEIDMVAGDRCTTGNLNVDPGDSLLLQIQPVLRDSDFCR